MELESLPEETAETVPRTRTLKALSACAAGILMPGFGHVILKKWDRALVFFSCITLMFTLGLFLQGRLFGPDFSDLFSALKFVAEAGAGLLYWTAWLQGYGAGAPAANTYDYANVYIYVAGLLNMLVVVDTFDIAMGRKR
jgi:hypothetical protein